MNRKVWIAVLTTGIAAVSLAGVGQLNRSYAEEDTARSAAGKQLLDLAQVKQIALQKLNGTIESIELERVAGKVYYEVEVEDNQRQDFDVIIDAYSGEVLKVVEDDRHDDDRYEDDWDEYDDRDDDIVHDAANNQGALITAEKAKKLAVEQYGGKVTEFELDEDDGRYVYEIELFTDKGEIDLEINAYTGDIRSVDYDD